MQVKIVNEAGIEEALVGMKFSFQEECDVVDITTRLRISMSMCVDGDDYNKKNMYPHYLKTALKLCKRDGGHNKFLEQIQVWMIIRAPLYFWKQFDTYRVGTSKLSKSTMHTLMKRELTEDDFEGADSAIINSLNHSIRKKDFEYVNRNLPSSFAQTRMVNTNYKVLRNMIQQRQGHKLQEWDDFITEMYNQLSNPELLGVDI